MHWRVAFGNGSHSRQDQAAPARRRRKRSRLQPRQDNTGASCEGMRGLQGLAPAGKASRIPTRRQVQQPQGAPVRFRCQGWPTATAASCQLAHQPERLLASRRFAPAGQQAPGCA